MRQLRPDVYEVGAIDWDRRLFDELIPLPDGTSYNAYLIKGSEKIALLDTVDPTKTDVLVGNLVSAGIDHLDYIVAHHGEQDHSGSIPDVLTIYPDAKVVVNQKCKDLLVSHLHIEEDRFLVITDGQTLSLGNKTLRFMDIPWVHWPETFATYLVEDRILFPCDMFGSHLATSSLFVDDWPTVERAAKRYYAEIMMPFRSYIRKHLARFAGIQIELIAPSHGPVYDKPGLIMDVYADWSSDRVKNEVVLAFVSMHNSTRRMVSHLIEVLMDLGITVRPFNLSRTDIGELAMALVDAATLVLATPTVLVGPHPLAAYAATLANALRPKTRFASIVCSYGWGGKAIEQLQGLMGNLKVELIDPVLVKGLPRDEDYLALDRMAQQILDKHKQAGIVQ
ncbi:MAG: FprA family A-type flavoprotein [Sedimentisphaerales bacterium]|jgi:flavorubredoxin|nr:FprA family A-type flavoprotein [Sedimentisphaerales bacterium]